MDREKLDFVSPKRILLERDKHMLRSELGGDGRVDNLLTAFERGWQNYEVLESGQTLSPTFYFDEPIELAGNDYKDVDHYLDQADRFFRDHKYAERTGGFEIHLKPPSDSGKSRTRRRFGISNMENIRLQFLGFGAAALTHDDVRSFAHIIKIIGWENRDWVMEKVTSWLVEGGDDIFRRAQLLSPRQPFISWEPFVFSDQAKPVLEKMLEMIRADREEEGRQVHDLGAYLLLLNGPTGAHYCFNELLDLDQFLEFFDRFELLLRLYPMKRYSKLNSELLSFYLKLRRDRADPKALVTKYGDQLPGVNYYTGVRSFISRYIRLLEPYLQTPEGMEIEEQGDHEAVIENGEVEIMMKGNRPEEGGPGVLLRPVSSEEREGYDRFYGDPALVLKTIDLVTATLLDPAKASLLSIHGGGKTRLGKTTVLKGKEGEIVGVEEILAGKAVFVTIDLSGFSSYFETDTPDFTQFWMNVLKRSASKLKVSLSSSGEVAQDYDPGVIASFVSQHRNSEKLFVFVFEEVDIAVYKQPELFASFVNTLLQVPNLKIIFIGLRSVSSSRKFLEKLGRGKIEEFSLSPTLKARLEIIRKEKRLEDS